MHSGTVPVLASGQRLHRTGLAVAEPVRRELQREVRDELLDVEQFSCLAEARVVIEDWREDYNTRRPHSALGMRAPVATLRTSKRASGDAYAAHEHQTPRPPASRLTNTDPHVLGSGLQASQQPRQAHRPVVLTAIESSERLATRLRRSVVLTALTRLTEAGLAIEKNDGDGWRTDFGTLCRVAGLQTG